MSRFARLAVLALFGLGAGLECGSVHADRTTAQFYAQRGETAAKAGDFAAAQGHYRKALEEDAGFLPARLGLGEALLGAGDRAGGIAELKAFADAADAAADAPAAWKSLAVKVRGRLADLAATDAQFVQIVDQRVADLRAFTEKWVEKDPEMAVLGARRLAKLRPDDEAATALLKKLGSDVPLAAAPGVHVFNGADWEGWLKPIPSAWSIVEGRLVADVPAEGAEGIRSAKSFDGDYDVVVEARLLEDRSGQHPMLFALHAAMSGDYTHSTLGVLGDGVFWHEETSATSVEPIFRRSLAELAKPVNVREWNRFEFRFRGDRMSAVLNGDVLQEGSRPSSRDRGSIGMRVQNAKIEVRRIDVVPR